MLIRKEPKCSFESQARNSLPIALTLILGLGASGCASNEGKSLPEFRTVHVRSIARPPDGFQIVAKRRLTTSQDMEENVGAGAVAGGIGYGIACVALIPLGGIGAACLGAAAGGAAVGSAAGAASSTVIVNPLDQYPPETRQQMEKVIDDVEKRRDFFVEIRDVLRASMPQGKQVDEGPAEALISIGPERILLLQDQHLQLALQMTATLSAEWSRNKRTPRKERRKYTYTTLARPIQYWLENNGAALNTAVTECVSSIVVMINADLDVTMNCC